MKKYQTNLSELIHKSIMSTKTSCNLAIDIAKGMTALHGASIIHFDLKPANILIDEIQPGEYKLRKAWFHDPYQRPNFDQMSQDLQLNYYLQHTTIFE